MPACCGRLRDAPRRFRAGAPPRPRGRGGMPPLPVQRVAAGGGRAATGRWATFAIRPAGRCSSGLADQNLVPAPPGIGPMPHSAEYGDLLDVIRESCRFINFRDVADEARRFLSLPRAEPDPPTARTPRAPAPTGSPEAAQRLIAMSQPIERTLVENYLRARGITHLHGT